MGSPDGKNPAETISRQQYRVIDTSLTAPILKERISGPLLNLIPIRVTPNSLTTIGGGAAGGAALCLWFGMEHMLAHTTLGIALLIASAVLLTVYGIFDQLDGMQARRHGSGSALGDFLDHWVDALMANLIPVTMLRLVGASAEAIVLIVVLIAYAWWANNWEVRNRGERLLPMLGGLEFIWVGVFIVLLSAVYGHDVWASALSGITLRDCTYAAVLLALLWSLGQNLLRSRHRRRDFLGPLLSIGPLAVWYLTLVQGADPSVSKTWHINAALLLIGMIGTKHAGDLMREHWLGSRYRSVDLSFALPAWGLAILGLAGQQWQPAPTVASALCGLLIVVGVTKLIWQLIDTYRRLPR